MNTIRSIWPVAVVGLVLIGGGLLMNYGTEVPSIGRRAAVAEQSPVMLAKLNQTIGDIGSIHVSTAAPPRNSDHSSVSRFVVAFPGAVLDKRTGLVWEESPDATPRTWTDATRYCVDRTVGGTIGWRLPSREELKSLFDLSMAPPFLPVSIFGDVQSTTYWSASMAAKAPVGVPFVHLVDDRVNGGMKSDLLPAWCVRGGMNTEQY